MKLYPVRPDVASVKEHFRKMSQGLLPRTPAAYRQMGFGMVGSRLRLGGHTLIRRPPNGTSVVVKEVTPAEVGVQQARAALAATALKNGTKPRAKKSSSHSSGSIKKKRKPIAIAKTKTKSARKNSSRKKEVRDNFS